jgi:malonyl-CoA O-methyltransferase
MYRMTLTDLKRLAPVRRSFDRAAARYEEFAVLSREVLARLQERMDLMQLAPRAILDLGSGTGLAARALGERFPAADVVRLDLSRRMLQGAPAQSGWRRALKQLSGGGRQPALCADFARLPLQAEAFDVVISNLALHWAQDPSAVLREAHRVLRVGGLMIFSTLGPDTLKELARAVRDAGGAAPAHPFVDMHDLGDALLASGFADPVMEMERIVLTYQRFEDLLRDLRGTGASGLPGGLGLRTPRWRERLAAAYERCREAGSLPATFEIVYGHAWKPAPRRQSDVSVIQVHRRPRSQ